MLQIVGEIDAEGGVDAPGDGIEKEAAHDIDPTVAAFADDELGVRKNHIGGGGEVDIFFIRGSVGGV